MRRSSTKVVALKDRARRAAPTGTEGRGDVFADLGFADADLMRSKAALAARIVSIVRARGLTQAAAAEFMGARQPHVSSLFRAHLDGFTIDRLMRYLSALGQDLSLRMPPTHAGRAGRIEVEEVSAGGR